MREANTHGADKYFHAKANCEAAQRGPAGVAVAIQISNMREWFDTRWPQNDPLSASAADQRANRTGRIAGITDPWSSCSSMLRELRPNGLPTRY